MYAHVYISKYYDYDGYPDLRNFLFSCFAVQCSSSVYKLLKVKINKYLFLIMEITDSFYYTTTTLRADKETTTVIAYPWRRLAIVGSPMPSFLRILYFDIISHTLPLETLWRKTELLVYSLARQSIS